jgi:hypothetical protein
VTREGAFLWSRLIKNVNVVTIRKLSLHICIGIPITQHIEQTFFSNVIKKFFQQSPSSKSSIAFSLKSSETKKNPDWILHSSSHRKNKIEGYFCFFSSIYPKSN